MRFAAFFLAFGLLACGDDDRRPARDAGVGSDGGTDASMDVGLRDSARPDVPPADGNTACGAPLDVVFVIDTSTSMEDELDQISNGIRSVWDAARTLTADSQFGLVVFVDDVVAVNGCAPFPTVDAISTELASWRDFTSTNRQPAGGGIDRNGDCAENSLDAFYTAATTCPWREGATRLIIHATDDTFAERPSSLSGISVQRTYAEVASELVTRELRVGTFAMPGAGEFCGAGTTPLPGVGFHEPYMGMATLPDQTGGRAWSIRDVRAGSLDMATAISELISDEYCTLF